MKWNGTQLEWNGTPCSTEEWRSKYIESLPPRATPDPSQLFAEQQNPNRLDQPTVREEEKDEAAYLNLLEEIGEDFVDSAACKGNAPPSCAVLKLRHCPVSARRALFAFRHVPSAFCVLTERERGST